jgi:hypothetical protein
MTMRSYLFGDEVTLIDATTAATSAQGTPAGDTLAVPPQPIGGRPPNAIFQVIVAGGTVSALVVDLLYSLDGTHWAIAQTVTGDLTGGVYPQTGIDAPFWAADVSTLTVNAATPAVTVKFAA